MTRVVLRIRRQDGPDRPETLRFEEFELSPSPTDSVATALFMLQRRPITTSGQQVAPVAFDSACRGSGCGACAILINGRASPACSTRLSDARPKRGPVLLEPLAKLPLVRDLCVDREPLRQRLMRAKAWAEGTDGAERSDRVSREPSSSPAARSNELLARIDRCTQCGACFEACPETSALTPFVGPAALNEARLLTLLASSDAERRERLSAVMARGGVHECGKARVCVEVCPEKIPLFDSILELSGDTARLWLASLLGR